MFRLRIAGPFAALMAIVVNAAVADEAAVRLTPAEVQGTANIGARHHRDDRAAPVASPRHHHAILTNGGPNLR